MKQIAHAVERLSGSLFLAVVVPLGIALASGSHFASAGETSIASHPAAGSWLATDRPPHPG